MHTTNPLPRPILKPCKRPLLPQQPQHQVHFPPNPCLARTFTVYSPSTYDRSPIIVLPNSCALPERGCPGRTYYEDEDGGEGDDEPGWARTMSGHSKTGKSLHPRSKHFQHPIPAPSPPAPAPLIPALVHDLSSESDESDGFTPAQTPTPPSQSPPSYDPPPEARDKRRRRKSLRRVRKDVEFEVESAERVLLLTACGEEGLDVPPSLSRPSSRHLLYHTSFSFGRAEMDAGCLDGF